MENQFFGQETNKVRRYCVSICSPIEVFHIEKCVIIRRDFCVIFVVVMKPSGSWIRTARIYVVRRSIEVKRQD